MSIKLLAIKFNHDAGSARADALNIRKNASTAISPPEWVRGMTDPKDSLAAYAIEQTKGHTISVKAKLETSDPLIQRAYVRAIQPPPPPPPKGWLNWILGVLKDYPILWYLILYLDFIGFGKNVLGTVRETLVTFQAGESGYVPFELENTWILRRGIGIHDVKWRWEYRLTASGPWTLIGESNHRIYTVLDTPTSPWDQGGFPDSQNPWTDFMDYTCKWAAGHTTFDGACSAITKVVNSELGLTYDMNRGASVYAIGKYFLGTQFLDYMKTGGGKGDTVNCSDCATIVTTFANLVGADLHASRMQSHFDLNEIKAIGQSSFGCPNWGCGFSYHEVAWKNTGRANDPLYDACLEVDGDNDPWSAPHSGLLPLNILFTTLASNVPPPIPLPFTAISYRERLCTNDAGGIGACSPTGPWPGTNGGRRELT